MRKLIGRGLFSRAYQIADDKVELVSVCMAKEAVAIFSQGNKFAPVMERIDYTDACEGVYHMPLYPKVRAPKQQLNAKAYALYGELRKLSSQSSMTMYRLIELIEASPIDDGDKEELISLAEDVCNAVDPMQLGFEISPRNITTNDSGDLILLDAFFCQNACLKAHTKKSA